MSAKDIRKSVKAAKNLLDVIDWLGSVRKLEKQLQRQQVCWSSKYVWHNMCNLLTYSDFSPHFNSRA
jgi:hypothetical protein